MRKCKANIWSLSPFLCLLWVCSFSLVQEKQKITIEWIHSGGPSRILALPSHVWLNDGTAIIYDNRKPMAERNFEKLNPKTGKRVPMLDMQKARKSLEKVMSGKTPLTIRWPEAFDNSGQLALYLIQGDIFLLNIPESRFRRVTETEEIEKSVRFSPDGKKLSFVRSNDLYVYDTEEDRENRLTFDGSETILNGTLSWVYWEEIFGRRDIGYWWSDDSKSIAYLKTDESPVAVSYFVDFEPYNPDVIKQRYPKVIRWFFS